MKIFTLYSVLIYFNFCFNQKLFTIKINQGLIRGKQILLKNGLEFFAFLGIPYGLPPVGSLRFKPPVPISGWKGILDVFEYKEPCPQFDASGELLGSENCLHLNIYTKYLNNNYDDSNKFNLLPVMIYVHAESFENGDSFLYGPEKLLSRDIILITFNYRLGILGFLSTEDEFAQGNYGLYDQILAFKWIKSNIIHFGGDPNMITVFGQGAGAASILYHLMSKNFNNYFNKAILQSGSNLCEWALEKNPLNYAKNIGKKLGCFNTNREFNLVSNFSIIHNQNDIKKNKIVFSNNPYRYPTSIQDKIREIISINGIYRDKRSNNHLGYNNYQNYSSKQLFNYNKINSLNKQSINNQDLVECLRRISLNSILNVQSTGKIFGEFPQRTAPTIEKYGLNKIIDEDPSITIRKSNFQKIPIIIGLNSEETAYFTSILNFKKFENISYFENIISSFLKATTEFKSNHKLIIPLIMNQYFNNLNLKNFSQVKSQFIKMSTDAAYGSCIDQTAKLYSRYGGLLYFYSFEYKSSNSMLDLLINLQTNFNNNFTSSDLSYSNEGVCHGDELFLLFDLKTGNLKPFTNQDKLIESRLITLWTEFAYSKFDFLSKNKLNNYTGLFNRNNKKNLFYGTNIFWPPYSLNNQYIRISNNLEILKKYRFKNLQFWEYLKSNFLNENNFIKFNSLNIKTLKSSTSLNKYAILTYIMIGVSIFLLLMVGLLFIMLWLTRRSQSFKTSIPGICNSNPSIY